MIDNLNINEVLAAINPADLDYQEWVNVGMALKDAGHSVSVWDAWSARDGARYHFGECVKKWETFGRSNNTPVTIGSVVQLAMDQGWRPEGPSRELDWDSTIGGKDDRIVVDKGWIEEVEIQEPDDNWQPAQQLITYLETLFEAAEKRKDPEVKKKERVNAIEIAFEALSGEGETVTTEDLAEHMGVTNRTVFRRLKDHGGFQTEKQGDGQPSIVRRLV